jgi:hypothetical protein
MNPADQIPACPSEQSSKGLFFFHAISLENGVVRQSRCHTISMIELESLFNKEGTGNPSRFWPATK